MGASDGLAAHSSLSLLLYYRKVVRAPDHISPSHPSLSLPILYLETRDRDDGRRDKDQDTIDPHTHTNGQTGDSEQDGALTWCRSEPLFSLPSPSVLNVMPGGGSVSTDRPMCTSLCSFFIPGQPVNVCACNVCVWEKRGKKKEDDELVIGISANTVRVNGLALLSLCSSRTALHRAIHRFRSNSEQIWTRIRSVISVDCGTDN